MSRAWNDSPTDSPTTALADCEHEARAHVHGTRAAYQQCGCRCAPCSAAYSRYQSALRAERTRRAARERGALPSPTRKPGRPARTNEERADEDTPGSYLDALQRLDPNQAHAAGLTVIEHANDDTDARHLLDILGITRTLTGATP